MNLGNTKGKACKASGFGCLKSIQIYCLNNIGRVFRTCQPPDMFLHQLEKQENPEVKIRKDWLEFLVCCFAKKKKKNPQLNIPKTNTVGT